MPPQGLLCCRYLLLMTIQMRVKLSLFFACSAQCRSSKCSVCLTNKLSDGSCTWPKLPILIVPDLIFCHTNAVVCGTNEKQWFPINLHSTIQCHLCGGSILRSSSGHRCLLFSWPWKRFYMDMDSMNPWSTELRCSIQRFWGSIPKSAVLLVFSSLFPPPERLLQGCSSKDGTRMIVKCS